MDNEEITLREVEVTLKEVESNKQEREEKEPDFLEAFDIN